MITIKPHHFIDIIKLYGKGITIFVPDKEHKHNFFSVGNEILKTPTTILRLTRYSDDICLPCKSRNTNGICIDNITHINGFTSKDQWNKVLDTRIFSYTNLSENVKISAYDFCNLIYSMDDIIFNVWKEESTSSKQDRYNNFCNGAKKYLNLKQ